MNALCVRKICSTLPPRPFARSRFARRGRSKPGSPNREWVSRESRSIARRAFFKPETRLEDRSSGSRSVRRFATGATGRARVARARRRGESSASTREDFFPFVPAWPRQRIVVRRGGGARAGAHGARALGTSRARSRAWALSGRTGRRAVAPTPGPDPPAICPRPARRRAPPRRRPRRRWLTRRVTPGRSTSPRATARRTSRRARATRRGNRGGTFERATRCVTRDARARPRRYSQARARVVPRIRPRSLKKRRRERLPRRVLRVVPEGVVARDPATRASRLPERPPPPPSPRPPRWTLADRPTAPRSSPPPSFSRSATRSRRTRSSLVADRKTIDRRSAPHEHETPHSQNYTGYRSDDASGAGLVPRGDPAASRDAGARGVQRAATASGIALGTVVIIFLFVCVMQCARSWWREERRRRAREAHENNPLDAHGGGARASSSGRGQRQAREQRGGIRRPRVHVRLVRDQPDGVVFVRLRRRRDERAGGAREREATAAAAAAAAEAAAAREEDEDEDEEGRGRRAAGGEDALRSSVGGSEDHLDRRDSPRRIVRSPSGSLRGGGRLGALSGSGSGSNATLSRLSGRSGGSPATSPDPSARSLSPSRDDAPSSAATTSASAPSPSLNPWAADDDALGGARGARRGPRGSGMPGIPGPAGERSRRSRRRGGTPRESRGRPPPTTRRRRVRSPVFVFFSPRDVFRKDSSAVGARATRRAFGRA